MAITNLTATTYCWTTWVHSVQIDESDPFSFISMSYSPLRMQQLIPQSILCIVLSNTVWLPLNNSYRNRKPPCVIWQSFISSSFSDCANICIDMHWWLMTMIYESFLWPQIQNIVILLFILEFLRRVNWNITNNIKSWPPFKKCRRLI